MKEYARFNKNTYDILAKEYELNLQRSLRQAEPVVKPFVDYLKQTFEKPRVLEIGPGAGAFLYYLEKNDFRTSAIDVSAEMLKIAFKTAKKAEMIQGDFLDYNFSERKFEGVCAIALIHLFPKDDAILVFRKIFQMLSGKGAFLVSTTIHEKSEEGFFEKSDYSNKMKRFRKHWTEAELLDEIRSCGFFVSKKFYKNNNGKQWIVVLALKE